LNLFANNPYHPYIIESKIDKSDLIYALICSLA
jgi:hypothetical protein